MTQLTEIQLASLREQLENQRKQLRNDIREELMRSDTEEFGNLAGQVHDAGEEAVADLLVDVNVTTISRHISELREVEAALQRIDSQTYGRCIDCDEDIPLERLHASPKAQRCVEHQELHDKQYDGEKKPSM